MYGSNSMEWSRLDNAAKIFPSTGGKTGTNVFRFYCELKEEVFPDKLRQALNSALDLFPGFTCTLKKGAFWFYLEQSKIKPKVVPEAREVCPPIYEDAKSPLVEASYFGRRINLEVYHALTDGAGAMSFFRTIVYNYLRLVHFELFEENCPPLNLDASITQKGSDSFRKYYKKNKTPREPKPPRTYRLKQKLRGDGLLLVIEGVASVKQVLEVAHSYGVSLTVFLAATLVEAVHMEMPLQNENKPVMLNIPVNLRKAFPSETARNFFGMISAGYNYSKGSGEFSDVATKISEDFKRELDKDKLAARMNKLSGFERNLLIRIAPLPLKNIVLRMARNKADKSVTTVLSNVGKVEMPPEMAEFIDMFGVLASTRGIQLSACSFGDKLQMGFTSAFASTDIQKNFFRLLTSRGIKVEIRSNDFSDVEKSTEAKQ